MSRHNCSKVSPQALDRPFALAAQWIPVTSRWKTSNTNDMTAFKKRKRKRVNIYFLSWRKKLKSHHLRELTEVSYLKYSKTLRYDNLAAGTVSGLGLIVSHRISLCALYTGCIDAVEGHDKWFSMHTESIYERPVLCCWERALGSYLEALWSNSSSLSLQKK